MKISEEFLTFVRGFPCTLCGRLGADAHHVIHRAWRESKRNDYLCIPLCRGCHTVWHTMGAEKALLKFKVSIPEFYAEQVSRLVAFFEGAYMPPEWEDV